VRDPDDDLSLRALVQLVEAQADQIAVLKRAVDELEGKLRLRAELDVLLGHEVRTPLTIVRGILHTLHERDLDPVERDDFTERALGHAVHLSDVVEDLLQPPDGLEAATLPRARMRQVRLQDLLHQAADAVASRAPHAAFRFAIDEDLMVVTAASRFVAIVVNLLENAAKYGRGELIEVTARLGTDQILVTEVLDRGPGLGTSTADELFAAFTRGPDAGAAPGRGVGLYLVRMLARSLGGDASLDDRPGGGMVARVRLPQRRNDDAAARAEAARDPHPNVVANPLLGGRS
jgi:signal transduction histidine kinase